MKLLKVYEVIRTTLNSRHSKTLVHKVIVENELEVGNVVSLLSAQALRNKRKCEGDDYTAYVVSIEDVTPSHKFIEDFETIHNDRGIIDYVDRINNTYDRTLVETESFDIGNPINNKKVDDLIDTVSTNYTDNN